MTVMQQMLDNFWHGFIANGETIAAYEQTVVPDDAALPYITYSVTAGSYNVETIETAFVWIRRESGVDAEAIRAAVFDQVSMAIPEEGYVLEQDGNYLILTRNPSDFLSCYNDPTDDSVLGGRVSYILRNCTL